jgi:hypothetical protein
MKHPYTGEDLVRVPRTCPLPNYDLTFGDCVVWQGLPWMINTMNYRLADGRPAAELLRYGKNPEQAADVIAPLDELRVFDDAKPYRSS